MQRKFFIFILALFSFAGISAQTFVLPPADAAFRKALVIYMAFKDTVNGPLEKAPSDEELTVMVAKADEGLQLFDSALQSTYSSTVRNAKYFHACLLYEKGYLYSRVKKNEKAVAVFGATVSEYEAIRTENNFPVDFYWKDVEYEIKQADFMKRLILLYVVYGHQYMLMGKYDEAMTWERKALAASSERSYLQFSANYEMEQVKEGKKEYDKELLDIAYSALNSYYALDSTGRANATKADRDHLKNVYAALAYAFELHPELDPDGSYHARTAPLLGWAGMDREEEIFYEQAMEKGIRGDEFYSNVSSVASNHHNKALEQKACDKWYTEIQDTGDGFYLKVLAFHYEQLGNAARAAELRNRAAVCEKRDAKAKRAAKKNR